MNFSSELRKIFWPIDGYEHKKFLPMAGMMFCILLNYSVLRSIKDGFVISIMGPEALSFLKTYCVLPAAVLTMLCYTKLCNIFMQKTIFYIFSIFFNLYLLTFAFILYPNTEYFHSSKEFIETAIGNYQHLKWFIIIMGNWTYATFYVIAELYGAVMLSLIFWQFANQITRTDEAKRFYSMFGVLGNFGLPVGSLILTNFLGGNAQQTGGGYVYVISSVVISGFISIYLYYWVNEKVLTDPKLYDPTQAGGAKKEKLSLSFSESIKMIISSKYLGLIALLPICYGISMNLVEGVWKSKLGEMFNTKEGLTMFMGRFQAYQGIASIIFMIIGANILRKVSWKTAALFTPFMILITGVIFFSVIVFNDSIGLYLAAFLATSPLAIAAVIGTLQNVVSKATKYSLFDSTKEMSYIPLDKEMRTKGKAAVEVIGGRFGKSSGGIIQSTFFLLMPTYSFVQATPYFASIFFAIVLLWLVVVNNLYKEYQIQIKNNS